MTGKYPVRSPHFQSTKDCSEFEGNPGNRGFQMMHKHKNNCFKVKLKGKQMIKGFVKRLQHLQQITKLHHKLIAVGRKMQVIP